MNRKCITTTPDPNPNPNRVRTYTVDFFSDKIHTVVTSTPAIARKWVYTLRYKHRHSIYTSSLIVGLGVQWRPTFTPDSDTAATLQLCVDKDCLIFHLHHAPSVPAALRRLLSDDRITFAGVHNGRDRALLEECEFGLEVGCLVDLATKYGYGSWSMKEMAAHLLGADNVVKPRWLGVSNWEASKLSKQQVQYACVDAHLSYCLAKTLKDREDDDDDDDDGSDYDSDDSDNYWFI